jgi:FecR protein
MNDSEPNSLRDLIASLPREIPPARDLWPEIQMQVERHDSKALSSAKVKTRESPHFSLRLWLPLAAAFTIVAVIAWRRPSVVVSSWQVDTLAGTPSIGTQAAGEPGQLRVGDWLETDSASRARVTVGAIGEVSVEPNSRLRLVNASSTNHRLELARGKMHALIWAPPRLFFVETPSATAVDLGCAYTLTVDDHGISVLEVTSGYVALDHGGRETLIPAGLMCRTRPGAGPGTPFSVNASTEFRQAIEKFDAGDLAAIQTIVTDAGAGDAVTLWHILARASIAARGPVFDKLTLLQPAPTGVTREGILAGDAAMRNRWALELGLLAYSPAGMK